jgi:hypothetical protein
VLEQISADLNRGIPNCLWLSESDGTDSVLGARSMPKPYSEDLRERVIEAVESGASRREAAENFRLSPSPWWRRSRYWKRQSEAERREQVAIGGARGMAAEADRRAAGFDAGRDCGRAA